MTLIKNNSRVFFAGQTGSGKTYLANQLLRDVKRLIVIDSKDELLNQFNLRKASKKNLRLFEKGHELRLQISPPATLSTNELDDYFDGIFQYLYSQKNYILYIDEIYGISKNSQNIPGYLNAILTRGRTKGIGLFSCSQRPRNIPLTFISESQHIFCFYLALDDDRKRMSEQMGDKVLVKIPDTHGYYYYDRNMRDSVYNSGT